VSVDKDYCAIANQYCDDVLSGVIPACRWIRLACERTRKDHARIGEAGWPYIFDSEKANRVCKFAERLKHVKDSFKTKAGENIVLLPYQTWMLTEIYGWVWADTQQRRFRRAYFECGRGNGKSTAASICSAYVFCEGRGGATAVCAASQAEQADIVAGNVREMLSKDEELCDLLGLEIRAHRVLQPASNSSLRSLPARSLSAEGLSIDVGVLDEVHAQRGRALHDVIGSGCSKKSGSLFLLVSTAGDDSSGIAWEIHEFLEKVLTGEADDPTYFCALYTIDPDDSWESPLAWQKANPSWNWSIDPRQIEEDYKRAKQIVGSQRNFRVKHLSEWILNGSDESFCDPIAIKKCFDERLKESEFLGQPATLSLDLASRLDLCAATRVHCKRIDGKIHAYAFVSAWLPEKTLKESKVVQYAAFVHRKELFPTQGSVTDQDAIESFVWNAIEKYKIRDVSFDPLQSNMLVNHIEKKKPGLVVEIGQWAKYMTPGCLLLQELVADGRLHTNSALLLWCLGNLRVRTVGTSLLQPTRPPDHTLKVDAAVSLIMSLRSIAIMPLDETRRAPRAWTLDATPRG
jgi:phage terminase large subunit-like protein